MKSSVKIVDDSGKITVTPTNVDWNEEATKLAMSIGNDIEEFYDICKENSVKSVVFHDDTMHMICTIAGKDIPITYTKTNGE